MKLFFLFLTVFIANSVQGEIIGSILDEKFNHPGICSLHYYVLDNEGKENSAICSGSYLGDGVFLSAHHCQFGVQKSTNLLREGKITKQPYFQCANKNYPIVDSIKHSSTIGGSTSQDLALFRVKDIPQIEKFHIIDGNKSTKQWLKEECFISGYGLDENKKFGVQKTARVTKFDFEPYELGYIQKNKIRLSENYAQQGDSGGPLYCIKDEKAYVIGVVHGGKKDFKYSDLELLESSWEWVDYHLKNFDFKKSLYVELKNNQYRCEALKRCLTVLQKDSGFDETMKKIIIELIEKLSQYEQLTSEQRDKNHEDFSELWRNLDCAKILSD